MITDPWGHLARAGGAELVSPALQRGVNEERDIESRRDDANG